MVKSMTRPLAPVLFAACAVFSGPTASADQIDGLCFGVGGDEMLYMLNPRLGHCWRLLCYAHTPGKHWAGATDSHNSPNWWWATTRHYETAQGTQGDNYLYKLSPVGMCERVGDGYGLPPEVGDMIELAYDETHDVLYGCTRNDLYTINVLDGTASHIGSFGLDDTQYMFALDYHVGLGKLFGVATRFSGQEPIKSTVHEIELSTGAATQVGSDNRDYKRVSDIWFDATDGQMYGVYKNTNEPDDWGGTIKITPQGSYEETSSGLFPPYAGHVTGLGNRFYYDEPVVDLSFSCYSEANAFVEATVLQGEHGEDSNQGTGTTSAYASAGAFASHDEMGEGEPGQTNQACGNMEGRIEATKDGLEACISSTLLLSATFEGQSEGEVHGHADTLFEGLLTVGTSEDYPEGAGGLDLVVTSSLSYSESGMTDNAAWDQDALSFTIVVWTDDPDDPLAEFSELGLFYLPVTAGEELNVKVVHYDAASVYSTWAAPVMWAELEEMLDFRFAVRPTFMIPEPGSAVVLLCGALAILRRRART